MIKLFWNTQNQRKSNFGDKKVLKQEELNYAWGLYHKKNSDKWIYEILKKVKYKIIQNETELKKDDILIIVDSSVEKKNEFYLNLKLLCSKIFLIHLGDETGEHDLSIVYQNSDHIWRTFCSNRFFKNDKVTCIPIGYKSGLINTNKSKREYKWAFVGTPHKSSRHDLLFQFSKIEPFFCHKTKKFDQKIISVSEMSEVLSSTEFMPCPNGFFHPETYRVYESLECECIPIVENAYKYYDRLFPNNPFLKVNMWAEAKSIINGWEKDQIQKKRDECSNWWKNLKNEIQESISNKIIK